LGNGGAAAAVIYVLRKTGMPFHIVSRALHNDSAFSYQEIDAAIIKDHQVIINTTPLGMYPDVSSCPDIPYDAIGKDHLLFDLVYNPATTKFLDEGLKRGAAIQNGEQMLILQAEENWRIWNS
jgi:shikimate dehydrogenase